MRQLDSYELREKFEIYSSDIKYCEVDDLTTKLTQFLNFLLDQEISKRILERIEEDFLSLKKSFDVNDFNRSVKFYKNILEQITTRELQGALGYFYIFEKFKAEKKYRTHYLDGIRNWYSARDYIEHKEKFNTYFFEPFIELFEWFYRESKANSVLDYFSEETQNEILVRIDTLEKKLGVGQEVVFNEVHDLKKLIKKLNKKNWSETIKGKFIDLAINNVISFDTAKDIIETITGDKIKFPL